MARVCNRHPFIVSEDLCDRCGLDFCRECLVFPRNQKHALCMACAIAKAGVRVGGEEPPSRREVRARRKARAQELAGEQTPPLPTIANPVPRGWALADDDLPLDLSKVQSRTRRRHRDAAPRRGGADSPNTAPKDASRHHDTPDRPASEPDIADWLDSLYTKD